MNITQHAELRGLQRFNMNREFLSMCADTAYKYGKVKRGYDGALHAKWDKIVYVVEPMSTTLLTVYSK